MTPNQFFRYLAEPLDLISYLLLAFILGLAIAYTYKKTHKSLSYSRSFVSSLVILLPIASLIIHFVSNNIASAIGVFGAFSVIRYRTAIKETTDMMYIFWVLAITGTALVSLMIYILYYTDFGSISGHSHLLIYSINTGKSDNSSVLSVLKQFSLQQDIINIKAFKGGKHLEVSVYLKLKKNTEMDKLVKEVESIVGVEDVNLVPSNHNIEY